MFKQNPHHVPLLLIISNSRLMTASSVKSPDAFQQYWYIALSVFFLSCPTGLSPLQNQFLYPAGRQIFALCWQSLPLRLFQISELATKAPQETWKQLERAGKWKISLLSVLFHTVVQVSPHCNLSCEDFNSDYITWIKLQRILTRRFRLHTFKRLCFRCLLFNGRLQEESMFKLQRSVSCVCRVGVVGEFECFLCL